MRSSQRTSANGMAATMFVTLALLVAGCGEKKSTSSKDPTNSTPSERADGSAEATDAIRFEEVTDRLGVDFEQVSGISEEKHFPSANGSGVAMFDFDDDGWLDLYFLTARSLPFESGTPGPMNELYRNIGGRRFEKVTAPSGLGISEFCHGVVQGDLDNDGFVDLVVTRYGGTILFRNAGDGTFRRRESFTDDRWGSSAAVADFDEDGDLDVYVTHYGIWSLETNERCEDPKTKIRMYCNPPSIEPAVHALYRNSGDGRFEDVTVDAGIALDVGRGQGVVATDVDLDGHVDLYVANDISPNFLFFNKGNGSFDDRIYAFGTAVSRDGADQAGMGVDCADYDRDGLPDLYVTNFTREYNALYRNLDGRNFQDMSNATGMARDSMDEVGWGTRLVDLDNDGWLDAFVTNGHVDDNIAKINPKLSYAQPAKVWRNIRGKLTLQEASSSGEFFERLHVGRGAAFGDYDNDGRMDIAVNHVDSPASVLRNVTPIDPSFPTPWLRLTLIGRVSNRDAIGARVTVAGVLAEGKTLIEQRTSGASYLSTHDPRLLIGVGKTKQVAALEIRWPSGLTTTLADLAPGKDLLLVEP